MRRAQDWPERLAAFLDSRRDVPFDWASNNCCSFAADAIAAMTDERPPLPEHASAWDAARLLTERGLAERVDDVMGPRIVPAMAQRGDLVLMLLDERETLGICAGEWMAGPGIDGLAAVPREHVIAAWRV